MTQEQTTTYYIMLWVTPILLGVLSFIGILAANALIKMGKDIDEIKITIERMSIKHDSLEKRVEKVESKLEYIENKMID